MAERNGLCVLASKLEPCVEGLVANGAFVPARKESAESVEVDSRVSPLNDLLYKRKYVSNIFTINYLT